jgi:Fe-S cluster assembly protein SufD
MTSTTTGAAETAVAPEKNAGAFVPVQTRSERPRSTNVDDFAAVTGRELEWKLSPVEKLRPLIDGDLDGSAYGITVSGEGGTVDFVDHTAVKRGVAGLPEDRLIANAWSQTAEVLQVTLSGDSHTTLRIDRSGLGSTPRAAHTIIHAKEGSQTTLVIGSTGDSVLGESVEIVVDQGAALEVVSVQEWNGGSVHYAAHFATVAKDGRLVHTVASMDGDVVVVNPSVRLEGQGATGEMYGVYFADETQHLEHRVFAHHVGPNTVSRVTYKGALHGKGARTVWIGDVLIGPDAVGTDSYEQNRNLVLSDGTRADSIPNLEIETGDIKGAGHASATGRFDDMHLFYLMSRGVPEIQARRLVVQGFLIEVLQKITDEPAREHLMDRVTNKLRATVEEEA